MSAILFGADKWIYQTLTTDAALKTLMATAWAAVQDPAVLIPPAVRPDEWCFSNLMVRGAAGNNGFPCVVFNAMSATDINANFARRLATKALYQVKVISRGGGFSDINLIYQRVDLLLNGVPQAIVDDLLIQSCIRQQAISYSKIEDTVRYNYLGGLYSLFINR